jgi:peroxiredoxin
MFPRLLIRPGQLAPEFELEDTNGNLVSIWDFHGRKHVLLAFLRGFM